MMTDLVDLAVRGQSVGVLTSVGGKADVLDSLALIHGTT